MASPTPTRSFPYERVWEPPGTPYDVGELWDSRHAQHLICNCPQYQKSPPVGVAWCAHIEEVLLENMDEPFMAWTRNTPRLTSETPALVEVPLFVGRGGMSVLVELFYATALPKGTLQVELRRPDAKTYALGYNSENCSRRVLRQMVLEFLVEHAEDTDLYCKSDIHLGNKQITVTDLKNKVQLVDLCSVLVDDWCRACVVNWSVTSV